MQLSRKCSRGMKPLAAAVAGTYIPGQSIGRRWVLLLRRKADDCVQASEQPADGATAGPLGSGTTAGPSKCVPSFLRCLLYSSAQQLILTTSIFTRQDSGYDPSLAAHISTARNDCQQDQQGRVCIVQGRTQQACCAVKGTAQGDIGEQQGTWAVAAALRAYAHVIGGSRGKHK